jgi:hypothetical protein
MKIKEIIKNKNFSIDCDLITNDNNLQFVIKLDPNEEVECVYYWYDHLTRGTVAVNQIEKSLKDKNWDVFSQYFYNMLAHKCTLPDSITVFLKSNNTIVGFLKMNEETIGLLDWSEYECG